MDRDGGREACDLYGADAERRTASVVRGERRHRQQEARPHIDVRFLDGYVLAPPSVVEGKPYVVEESSPW
jgi:hypothetical protein